MAIVASQKQWRKFLKTSEYVVVNFFSLMFPIKLLLQKRKRRRKIDVIDYRKAPSEVELMCLCSRVVLVYIAFLGPYLGR